MLVYVFARMLWPGSGRGERDGPLVPVIPMRWVAIAAIALACARIALNIVDSHVIDIGVAGVVGADHITHGQNLYAGTFARAWRSAATSTAPFNYLAYVPFELIFPWNGHWGSVPAAHAAAIAFDLLTAVGLWRPRPAAAARARRGGPSGSALAFAWLAYPFTLYTMNANANDSLIAALVVGAMLALTSAPARAVARRARRRRPSSAPRPLAPLFATGDRRAALALARSFFGVVVRRSSRRSLVVPFLPDGGLREFYDHTLGYQASRSSPFSVWGQAPSLDFLQSVERGDRGGAGARRRLLAPAQDARPRSRRSRRR